MMKKIRLDQLLIQHNLAENIHKAQAMIGAGEVYVNDTPADKAGASFPADVAIRVKEKCPYVSRGGLKLERGLKFFQMNPAGFCCLDVGASSGGFTDCLLQNDAAKVFAVDVAYGQLDWKMRQDERVVVIERFNARKLTPEVLKQPVDLAVMDTSFISITKIIPYLLPLFSKKIQIIALIKPQFELPKHKVGKGGVVRDSALHQEAIDLILDFADKNDLTSHGVVESPIRGPKGNIEFLIYLSREEAAPPL